MSCCHLASALVLVAKLVSGYQTFLQSHQSKPAVNPAIPEIIKSYAFQPVRDEKNQLVNVVLVRAPFRGDEQATFEKYKDEILFLGISSFEDFPLFSGNPYSGRFSNDKYVGMFPGFLTMFHHPEEVFPSNVTTLLMSQSDFALPNPGSPVPKKYDFVMSGSDQDVLNNCVGWSSFAKNWSFAVEALDVMCGEFNMTGVLVATKDKSDTVACTIPDSCKGKVLQTTFLDQGSYFDYVKQSRFQFLPQVHDASPRVITQALAHNVPIFVNDNIMGGWKYVNEQTGAFFHDLSDFRPSLKQFMARLDTFEPRDYVTSEFGDQLAGAKLRQFVEDNFSDRVQLRGAQLLFPAGA